MDMYDWEVKYRPGKQNGNADALSRLPQISDCEEEESVNLPLHDIGINSLFMEEASTVDQDCRTVNEKNGTRR